MCTQILGYKTRPNANDGKVVNTIRYVLKQCGYVVIVGLKQKEEINFNDLLITLRFSDIVL